MHSGDEGDELRCIPVFSGPGDNFEQISGLVNNFSILFSYLHERSADGKDYVLVGFDNKSRNAYGWVDLASFVVWPGRVGASFNTKIKDEVSEPVFFFKTDEDLGSYIKSGDTRRAVWEESLKDVADLSITDFRMPVLGSGRDSLKILFDSPQRIVARGGAYRSGMGNYNRDVFFLVDGTAGVDQRINAVREGLKQFTASLPLEQRGKYRFGVAVFRDYIDGPKGYEIVAPLGAVTEKVFDRIKDRNGTADNNFAEAMFQGIVKTVKRADWHPDTVRTIVLVGDRGNRLNDPEGYTMDDVADTLGSGDSPVLLYAVKLGGKSGKTGSDMAFSEQVKTINLLNDRFGGISVVKPGKGLKDASRAVRDALQEFERFSSDVNLTVSNLMDPRSGGVNGKYGSVVARYTRNMAGTEGAMNQWDLSNVSSFSEVAWAGLQARNGKDQFKFWVLWERSEFAKRYAFFSMLKHAIESRNSRNIRSVMSQLFVPPVAGGGHQKRWLKDWLIFIRFRVIWCQVSLILRPMFLNPDCKMIIYSEKSF